MGKFKVGDKVRRVSNPESFIDRYGKDFGVVTSVYDRYINVNSDSNFDWSVGNFELIIEVDWSVYNNTKVLRDLSDEQRGLLFNSWVKDKDCIEFYYGLMEDFEPTKNVIWDSTVIYRVRQKSERELFIEEWSSKIATAAYRNESISQLVGEMFDAKLESCDKEKTNAN